MLSRFHNLDIIGEFKGLPKIELSCNAISSPRHTGELVPKLAVGLSTTVTGIVMSAKHRFPSPAINVTLNIP